MSRLNDLLRKLESTDPALAKDLKREVDALAHRRAFGLNFERHVPEAVELPGRPVRRGDKVRILPPRGSKASDGDPRLWRVVAVAKDFAGARTATLELIDDTAETAESPVEDLVVVAEFRDPIYPGLVSTGKVERGGDKPYHAVINAENYHALQTLLFTHRGKVDAIYIDPPYNTGAKDWKYNNDYVEGEDLYRHSKWLAFMERRLLLARDLLNAESSILIVAIDEKEYLRLGLLLEQVFPSSTIQMVSVVMNGQGSARKSRMARVDEYLFFVYQGNAAAAATVIDTLPSDDAQSKPGNERIWFPLIRGGKDGTRAKSWRSFFPIFVDEATGKIVSIGEALPLGQEPDSVPVPEGQAVLWPIGRNGEQGRWQMAREEFERRLKEGFIRVGVRESNGRWPITYIREGVAAKIKKGEIEVLGRDHNGAFLLQNSQESVRTRFAKTVWYVKSHNAGTYGTALVDQIIPGRAFPFPKSLYAVEDALRFFVADKPDAMIVDFFAGSGTTAHALMRLNKQDGGRRRSISVTNNEVAANEQAKLRASGLRPGDAEWEQWGICDYITKPRIAAVITGKTPAGDPIKGDYKFIDVFPMADGFEENVEFFTLTYEAPLRVSSHREFAKIAPLLWLRAGSEGRRIDDVSSGWDVAETYGVLADLNRADEFVEAIAAAPKARLAFIVTDEDRLFEAVVRDLPEHVEPVRLYEAYLHNFEIETGRSAL